MKTLKKIYDVLTKVEVWALFIIFFFATASTVVNVILRKLFAFSFNWIDELSRFIMLITICMGMSIAISHGSHPKMDTIQALFKGKGKIAVTLVADVVLTALMAFGAFLAVQQELKTIANSADLATMPLKLWMFWLFVPLGFTGGAVRSLFNVIFDIMGFQGKDPRQTMAETGEEVEEA